MSLRSVLSPLAFLTCAIALFCSSGQPAAAGVRGQAAAASHATIEWLASSPLVVPVEPGDSAELVYAKSACAHPKFPLVCVKQGSTGTLSIQENCYVNGQPVNCGTVTWSATTSNRGLAASFSPNPGNPSLETIAASQTIKPGHYYQLITASCTGVPNCPANYKAAIVVLK